MKMNGKKIADECLGKQEKYEEEFKAILISNYDGIEIWKNRKDFDDYFGSLIEKYIEFETPVIIKVRKGKIVIEKIK